MKKLKFFSNLIPQQPVNSKNFLINNTNMKKTLLITVALLSISSFSYSQMRFGAKAGLNLANVSIDADDDVPDTKMLPSFHIGGILDYSVNDFLAIQPGLMVSGKGYKYEETYVYPLIGTVNTEFKLKPIYIDIPVMIFLRKDVGGLKIFGGLGPYMGIGIAGKYETIIGDETDDGDIEWGSDDNESDLKRGDFGLAFGGGIEASGLLFSINYELGLSNNDPAGSSDYKSSNRVLGISIGYLFGE